MVVPVTASPTKGIDMNKDTKLDPDGRDHRDIPYVIHEEVLEEVDGGAKPPGKSNLTSLAVGEEAEPRWI